MNKRRIKTEVLYYFVIFTLIFLFLERDLNSDIYDQQNKTSKQRYHTADRNRDKKINLSELLRVIQFFNTRTHHCDATSEDGYAPGPGDQSCTPHDSDYEPSTPWKISLIELLRLIQFYNTCGYEEATGTEDGFKPVLCIPIQEGEVEGVFEGSVEGESSEGEGTEEGEGLQYARIVVDRVDTVPNSECTVKLELDVSRVSFNSIQFDLIYNSFRVQYRDFMPGIAVINAGKTLSVYQIVPGRLRITASGNSASGMQSGVFALLRMKVSEDVEFGDIYSLYGENITAITYPEQNIFPLSVLAGHIRIYSAYPYPPKAKFSATPTKNLVGAEIEFQDESKLGNGTNPEWLWNFGDGNYSTERNPIHIYNTPGLYTVTLTVTTTSGSDTLQKQNYIEIVDKVRIYVKKTKSLEDKTISSEEPDGLSWETAFTTIQEGIDKAYELGGGEVWVASGNYNELRNNPAGALIMRELVNVYGGFRGNESSLEERNVDLNITTILGETARSGAPAWHVVVGENHSLLDGFVIRGGQAQYDSYYSDAQNGGGIYLPNKRFVIRNCKFYLNKAVGAGGAICCLGGKLLLQNCHFIQNSVEDESNISIYPYGGAIYISDAQVHISNCIFESNNARAKVVWQNNPQSVYAVSSGGAIFAYNSTLSIKGSRFTSNTCVAEGLGDGVIGSNLYGAMARSFGGALYLWFTTVEIRDTFFTDNSVSTNDHLNFSRASGAMIYMTRSSGRLINVIGYRNKGFDFSYSNERTGGIHLDLCENVLFVNNTLYGNQIDLFSMNHGGAVYNYYSNAKFVNTIIWGNSGQGTFSSGNDATFMYCNLQTEKNGEGNISADPQFVFPAGGNLKLSSWSPCIDRGMDTSAEEWGGVLTDIEGVPRGRNGDPSISADGSDYDIGAYEF